MFIKKTVLRLFLTGALSFSMTTVTSSTLPDALPDNETWSLLTLNNYQADAAQNVSISTLFSTFDMHWDSLDMQASGIVSQGDTPMITLMPSSSHYPNLLTAIALGAEDAYITSWIEGFRTWRDSYPEGKRPGIILRFGHGFNTSRFPWGNKPEGFKAAWRHIHHLFEAADVNDSVKWVWSPSAVDTNANHYITRYYPGDELVDWISLENAGNSSSLMRVAGRNFGRRFNATYVDLVENFPEKPLLIAETVSVEKAHYLSLSLKPYSHRISAIRHQVFRESDVVAHSLKQPPAQHITYWLNTRDSSGKSFDYHVRSDGVPMVTVITGKGTEAIPSLPDIENNYQTVISSINENQRVDEIDQADYQEGIERAMMIGFMPSGI